jgi:choline dehydrogenase
MAVDFAFRAVPYSLTARGRFRSCAYALIVLGLVACDGSTGPRRRGDAGAVGSLDAYEYIVVGSGAGGGPVASRLARDGHRVLVVEAGEDVGGALEYRVPARHALSTESAPMAWWFFVQHHTDVALDREDSKWTDQGILYPRGSALGGSTAVNAMVTVLPSRGDWDRLAAATGDPGWRASEMDRYEARVREWLSIEVPDPTLVLDDVATLDMLRAAADVHTGHDGVGSVLEPSDVAITGSAIAGLLGRDLNEALHVGETTGLYRLPLATRRGERRSTRELLLETVAAGHPLTILTGAFATRVLFTRDDASARPRAIGVEIVRGRSLYRASLETASLETGSAAGAPEQVLASREVILSAGAFNSPQLLMLSGIGDPASLEPHGIETIVPRVGVGRNLQDRYEVAVVGELGAPLSIVAGCELDGAAESDPCQREWNQSGGGGVYGTSGFLATVLRRSSSDAPYADLQIFASPSDVRGYFPGYSRASVERSNRFSWVILKGHSRNHDGRVELGSADPFDRPRITFASWDEEDPLGDPDLRAMIDAVAFVRRIHARMRDLHPQDRFDEIWPGPEVREANEIGEWIRREAWGHHASCSNRMGSPADAGAVVDSRLRVIGADALRVVDASVFPDIPGTFIAMPTFMLAERAADLILEDAR